MTNPNHVSQIDLEEYFYIVNRGDMSDFLKERMKDPENQDRAYQMVYKHLGGYNLKEEYEKEKH